MAEAKLPSLLRQLRHVVVQHCDGGLSDADLLQRFVAARDPAAFEVLVWRHGPMVLGLCRRVLGHYHDAEDALQATFLALARQAGSIGKRASLAGWLCKVAYRVAFRARKRAGVRASEAVALDELPACTAPGPAIPSDLQLALDQELQRLPEKYRSALVLCYWSGLTHQEIAGLLACPVATVSTRLARGRALLRTRLARRGVTVSAAGLTSCLGEAAAAALPLTLVQATVRGGVLFAAGRGAAAGVVPPGALALAEGALQMTTLNKFKVVAVVLLVLAGAGAGAAWLAPTPSAEAQANALPAPAARNAEAPPPAQAKKEMLRYGGKSFDEWFSVLTTELKPDVRAEAIKALSAFGANGYAKQAASALVVVMREYKGVQADRDDQKVVFVALQGIGKIGPDAVPVLLEELNQGPADGRRFALHALQRLKPGAKSTVLAVAERLSDPERDVRELAVATLRLIDADGHSAAALGQALVSAPELRLLAAMLLLEWGDKAKVALPQLLQAVKEFPEARAPALAAVRGIGPKAATILPVLVSALKDKDQNVRLEAINYLEQLGPTAKDAVKPLLAAWKQASDDGERTGIANTLGSIGPAAKEALPVLLEAMAGAEQRPSGPGPGRQNLAGAIRDAVRKISPQQD